MSTKLQTYPKYKPSGIDWLGDIPVGWGTKRNLGLFSERNERVKYFAEDDFELLSVTIQKGVVRQLELAEDEQRKDSSNDDKGNYKWVRRGDIAYNKMRMWQGAAGESKHEGIVSPAYIILKPKTGVLPRYFHYFFRTEMFNEIAYQYGYGIADDQHSLRYWQFKTLYSPFPPPETQKQIADFLDEKTKIIDELIAKKKKLIELLREKRAALITRAVTKGLNPKAKMKPSGISWLDDIPERWEVKRIKFVAKLYTGNSISDDRKPEFSVENNGYSYISSKDIDVNYSTVDYENGMYIPKDSKEFKIAPAKSMLLCVEGGSAGRKIAYIDRAVCFVNKLCCITSKKMNNRYIFYFHRSKNFQDHFELNISGLIGGVSMQRLKDFLCLQPTNDEQKQIADFLDIKTAKIDKATALIESQIEKLKEYRSSLIYSAVTGKIKI